MSNAAYIVFTVAALLILGVLLFILGSLSQLFLGSAMYGYAAGAIVAVLALMGVNE